MPPIPLYEKESPHRCQECGQVLTIGRNDRKFCSSACKNRYHNRQRASGQDLVLIRTLRVLHLNRSILQRLCRLGIHTMDRLSMVQLGFDFHYFTSMQWMDRKRCRYVCFEYTYELTPSRIRRIAQIGSQTPAGEGAGKGPEERPAIWLPFSEDP